MNPASHSTSSAPQGRLLRGIHSKPSLLKVCSVEGNTGTTWNLDYKYRISHGPRNLADYSPWGYTESDMTEATERTLGPP